MCLRRVNGGGGGVVTTKRPRQGGGRTCPHISELREGQSFSTVREGRATRQARSKALATRHDGQTRESHTVCLLLGFLIVQAGVSLYTDESCSCRLAAFRVSDGTTGLRQRKCSVNSVACAGVPQSCYTHTHRDMSWRPPAPMRTSPLDTSCRRGGARCALVEVCGVDSAGPWRLISSSRCARCRDQGPWLPRAGGDLSVGEGSSASLANIGRRRAARREREWGLRGGGGAGRIGSVPSSQLWGGFR